MTAIASNNKAAPVIDQNTKAKGVSPTVPAYLPTLVETPNKAPPAMRQVSATTKSLFTYDFLSYYALSFTV